jgi:hypothetical protein
METLRRAPPAPPPGVDLAKPCVTCLWRRRPLAWWLGFRTALQCGKPDYATSHKDPVMGTEKLEMRLCLEARRYSTLCGPEGKGWEPTPSRPSVSEDDHTSDHRRPTSPAGP